MNKNIINKILSFFNLKVVRKFTTINLESRFINMLSNESIDLVIDVGANTGQFASYLRDGGYCSNILSLEPASEAHDQLLKNSKRDNNWHVYDRVAVGSSSGIIEINISSNSVSSSVLDITDIHIDACEDAAYIDKESVLITTLNEIIENLDFPFSNIALKIDTQGYELEVLKGIMDKLPLIKIIFCETSFNELYKNQPTICDVQDWMRLNNYVLWDIQRGFVDPTSHQVLQADILYKKLP